MTYLIDEKHNDNARTSQRNSFENHFSNYLTNALVDTVSSDEIVQQQLESCTLDVKETNNDSFQIVINVDYARDYGK
tara:strand:- start:877 stop:1107 length:231 start_codon:yes stop_codon:yes gene_type:complete